MSSEADYWVGPTIGEGSFGHVVYAVHKTTNRKVAIKVLEVDTSDRKQQQAARIAMVRNERQLLSLPRVRSSPWIVDLWAAFCGKPCGGSQCLYLVLELASGGDLRGLIHEGVSSSSSNNDRRALWNQSRGWYASQLIRAVDSLHALGILHCDLKPENVLLDASTGRLRLADFGCAVELPKQQQPQTVPEQAPQPLPSSRLEPQMVIPRGTALYASPEVLRALPPWKLTVGVDYWSVGCILHALWHGSSPFDRGSEALTVRAIFAKAQAGSSNDNGGGEKDDEEVEDPAQQFVQNDNDEDDDVGDDDHMPLRRLSRDLVAVLPEDRIRAWKNQALALASVYSQNDNVNGNDNDNRCHGEGTMDPPPGEDQQPACSRKPILLPTPEWQEEVDNATLRDGSLGWLVFQL